MPLVTAVELVCADSADLWTPARRLVEEYAASLGVDLAFQGFPHEIQSLASDYGPPHGCFVLASHDSRWVGCGGLRRLSTSICEMKRLYVAPAGRGRGIGLAIAEALITNARQLGYAEMLLDTLPSMTHAQQIYTSLGFVTTDPYRFNPIPGASYWRLDLL
jgi:GNAT superfamily N-acetyltransferase